MPLSFLLLGCPTYESTVPGNLPDEECNSYRFGETYFYQADNGRRYRATCEKGNDMRLSIFGYEIATFSTYSWSNPVRVNTISDRMSG